MPEDTAEGLRGEMAAALNIADPGAQQRALDALGPRYEKLHGTKEANLAEGATAGPPASPEEQDASYWTEAIKICDDETRQAFGADYDVRMEGVRAVAEELFNTPELRQAAGRIENALLESGVSLSQINILLDRIARRAK